MKRRLLSLLLALVMILSLAATVSAYPNHDEYIDEEDPNDTLWDAQPIELGETYSGHAVAYCGDSDLFTFTLEESSLIRITMEATGDTIDLALFDSTGKLLSNATYLGKRGEVFDLFTIYPMELAAGTYYVGIWTTDGTNHGYFFEVHQREFMCEGYHQFFTQKPITPATCQSEGVMLCTCLCGATTTESVPADPYAHTFATEIVTPSTCTENGLAIHTCTGCGYQEEETLWAEHTAPGKLVIQEPTMDDYGFYYLTCSDCGFVDTEEERGLYPLDHMFIDVKPGEFYELPVCWAVYKEITSGSDAYHFNPNGQCLRAQVVTFLWRAEGCPEPTTTVNPFVDVKETDFYYKAVLWAVENGITNGADATHFNPMGVCNRAQVVTFLHRAKGSPAPESMELPFTDVPADQWFAAPVAWAVENGVTNGISATEFGPNAACNRAQVVTFLYRAAMIPDPAPADTYTFTLTSNDPDMEIGFTYAYGSEFKAGDAVRFYAEPWFGYLVEFSSAPVVEGLELRYLGAYIYELTMPEHDLTVHAEFVPATGSHHTITTACQGGEFITNADYNDDFLDIAKPGEHVLFYIYPDDGYTLTAENISATANGAAVENFWFLGEFVDEYPEDNITIRYFLCELQMPDADVSVTINCTAGTSANAVQSRMNPEFK